MGTPRRSALSSLPSLLEPGFFKALCDPNRVALLAWLAVERSAHTVTEIANAGCCAVDVSVVSRHLSTLRDAGMVIAEKRGKEVFYHINAMTIVTRLRQIADLLESCGMRE